MRIHVDGKQEKALGKLPPVQGDISQGAETGDPFFFEEMEHLIKEIKPGIIRVEPFAGNGRLLKIDDKGDLQIDFSQSDRIIYSLRRAGCTICWNNASWPKQWTNGYPKDINLWSQYVRKVVERYNKAGQRNIEYIEFWNEPHSFDTKTYGIMANTAVSIDPGVKCGGPAVMDLNTRNIEKAVKFAHEGNAPLHFISFHLYGKSIKTWHELLAKAQAILDKYPGYEKTEMILTEWGLDAGESGVCDTRYNACYYNTVLENLIGYWPQVRPTYFELRDGWDWKGPSRDLFGRWGMLTYPNLLPKPVFQAARMWAMMADNRISAQSNDPRIHVVASQNQTSVTILLWSFPDEYWRTEHTDPALGASVLDIPVEIDITNLPFRAKGLSYQRYQLDYVHSNVRFNPQRSRLEKVHHTTMNGFDPKETFRVRTVMPLHGAALILLRPAEGAPAEVDCKPDRYQLWAGEKAIVQVQPTGDQDFPIELIRENQQSDGWDVHVVNQNPFTLELRPHAPHIRSQRFFNAWLKRSDWRAMGRICAEFRVDTPLEVKRENWRTDIDPVNRTGKISIPVYNKMDHKFTGTVQWELPEKFTLPKATEQIEIRPLEETVESKTFMVPKDTKPGKFSATTIFNNGLDVAKVETAVFMPMTSHYTTESVKFDGQLGEWKSEPLLIDTKNKWSNHPGSKWMGPHDCSAMIWSKWDEQYLYFAFRIVDDHHYCPVATRDMHKYDCIHLGFDLKRDALNLAEFFHEDDCDYLFGFTDKAVAYRHWGAKRREEVPKMVLLGGSQKGNVTIIVIGLPWKEEFIPYAEPKAGHVMGFTCLIRDIDEGEKQGFMAFGDGLRWHEKRPATFSSLFLAD
ncbi:MAG: hypothetical protein JRJ86_21045 [Deltaproteobacteria bacterium]|nr:hypothetical protein [Deltaproteobacteria bacterium]